MTQLISIVLLFVCSSTYGQQYLWSTGKINSTTVEFSKIISIDEVTDEVLQFYEVYDGYYDLSGYSKEEFMKESVYGLSKSNWLTEINELTVFAIRANSGNGSYVVVMCVSKSNVNAIIFSNSTIKGGGHFNIAGGIEQDKFVRWFKTLLN